MSRFVHVQKLIVLSLSMLLLQGCTIPPPSDSESNIEVDSEQTAEPVVETPAIETETTVSQDQPLVESNLETSTTTPTTTIGTNGPPPENSMDSSSDVPSVTEHKGTKTSWEALRAKVTGEINEHQRQIQQLNLKLQLIDQIATRLELTTKALSRTGHAIVADFIINNPTTYVLKDISITCDQIAPTGTTISSYTETIYAIVDANTTQTFNGIELDQWHRQTQSLRCEIKNFTVHTPAGS